MNLLKNKISPGFKQLLIKIGIFVVVFILFSLIIGQKIVSSSLLEKFNIAFYGGLGYIFLFSIFGFIVLYRNRLSQLKDYKFKKGQIIFLLASISSLICFYILELNISSIEVNVANIIFVHLSFLSPFVFLLLGIFGLEFIKGFIKEFKKELIYFLIFGVITYSLMNAVWSLWPYFSLIVLKVVYFLLSLISQNTSLINSTTIMFDGFAAQIAEACSGIYSIFIFSSLYIFSVLLDWKKINKIKAIGMFIPAILGAFLINILRVFFLMIIGAHISKEIALGFYHSYTGMIFFLIYFAVFWMIFYKWMKK